MDKYKLVSNEWPIPTTSYRASGMWKSILTAKSDFDKWIRYRANNGREVGQFLG